MPSWSIHTAHVERLFENASAEELGIEDANAFLFGNYVPDIYLGFLVENTSFRLDYCLTHLARPSIIPLPESQQFWDDSIIRPTRRPKTPSGISLALGVWTHLVADRVYNERFRQFCETREVPSGDELRERKQADFALFGSTLGASTHVRITSELLEAAQNFRQYSILPDDVHRAVKTADALLRRDATPRNNNYQLLSSNWMHDTFEACHDQLLKGLTHITS